MAKLEAPKRIRTEDFDAEYQQLISKLGFVINDFLQQTYNAFNGNLDFSNINQQVSRVRIKTDGSGDLQSEEQIKVDLKTKPQGIIVIKAENQENPTEYPDSAPFVSWTLSGNIITIKNVTGLPNDADFYLTLLIIGS